MRVLSKVATGEVDQAVRRWRRPTVKAGGRLRTAIGELSIDVVERIEVADLGPDDARRCGADSVDDLVRDGDGELYRVVFHLAGPDPRVARRADAALSAEDRHALDARLERFDRSSTRGPWTSATLALIAAHPGRRAPDLAAELGVETAWFKPQVRKLKELGLTESLEVGYRLSPRGEAYLAR